MIPLGIILTVRFIEMLVDEIGRYRRDRKLNLEAYQVYDRVSGRFRRALSQDVRQGDIIRIVDQRVPADIVILKSK